MNDFKFRKSLSTGEPYDYQNMEKLPIYFDDQGERPVFTTSTDENRFEYSNYLQISKCSIAKMLDIMNTSPIPIKIRVGGVEYLAAKGFLGRLVEGNLLVLFSAMCRENQKSLDQVKFLVCNKILNNSRYAGIKKAITELIINHPGPVFIDQDVFKYFGIKLEIPEFGTIKKRKEWLDNVVKESLEDLKKKD